MACFDPTDAHSGESSMTNSASANHQQTQFGVPQQQNLGEYGQQHETTNGTLNYEAAAAAGQARANSNEVHEVNIERLVAASGYGQIHLLNVCSKPYHAVGRNVTVFRDIQRTEHHSEGSHGSSLASNDAHFHCVTCRIGVSPVISTSLALDVLSPQVVTDHENSNKRRKHHHVHRRHQRASLVTHYCIQLEKVVSSSHESSQQNFGGSQSSQSVSNGKPIAAEQHAELSAGVIEHAGEHSSQSSDPREPVTTIGWCFYSAIDSALAIHLIWSHTLSSVKSFTSRTTWRVVYWRSARAKLRVRVANESKHRHPPRTIERHPPRTIERPPPCEEYFIEMLIQLMWTLNWFCSLRHRWSDYSFSTWLSLYCH